MPDLLHSTAELCIQMDQAPSEQAVREVLRSAAPVFGADFFLFGMRTGNSVSPPVQLVISNYPKPWQRYYDGQGAFAFDPIILRAIQAPGSFRWDGLHKDERQLALRRESVRNGMTHGFSTADHAPDRSFAILSFCGERPLAPEPEEWEASAASAALLASTTNRALTRIILARNAANNALAQPLTDAERQALELTAAAMTADEAAAVLKVQPRTVRYYLDRAAEKLGVNTRKEAVMKALAEGIIDLRHFPPAGFEQHSELYE